MEKIGFCCDIILFPERETSGGIYLSSEDWLMTLEEGLIFVSQSCRDFVCFPFENSWPGIDS